MSESASTGVAGLEVHRETGPAGIEERLQVAIGLADHQVHVERQPGVPPDCLHDHRPHRQIRDEVPVHHVDMNQVGPARFDHRELLTQDPEVGSEDGRRKQHGHRGSDQRLTSSEIASPGAIWNPAWGFWRRTTPAGTPG